MKKLIAFLCVLALTVGAVCMFASAESYIVTINGKGFTDLEEAIVESQKGGIMVLQQDIPMTVDVPEGLTFRVDLNGKSVPMVRIPTSSKLYVMDSATDDFDGSDCGVIGVVEGEILPLNESDSARYLPVWDDDGLSFHYVEMTIEAVRLSADDVGFAYDTTFKGDEAVENSVKAFGIALSVQGEPVVEANGKLSSHSKCTTFTDFVSGGADNAGSSSKLVGILKDDNAFLVNVANAEQDIFGKPYIQLNDGSFLLGELATYDLKWVAEQANVEENWENQTEEAQVALGELYERFSSVMKTWSVAKLKDQAEVNFQNAESRVLKILTLGHSLALDSGHMLALVADAQGLPEGYDELVVGTLYYSGCELWRHVQYLTNNSPEYALYMSSTKTADQIPTITKNVTMKYALTYDYWDIIIMQGGVFEIAKDATYTNGNIETIQAYVNQYKRNPNATFGWHMQWAPPTDDDLRATYPNTPNWYVSSYEPYGDDRQTLYNAIADAVETNVLPNETFDFIIPSGTAMQNAWSSSFTEKQLHRDYVHASEYGRIISSYTWYCRLFGIDQLDEIKLDAIPKQFFHASRPVRTEPELTQLEKDVLLESVNNALANPFEMTQSQYTD